MIGLAHQRTACLALFLHGLRLGFRNWLLLGLIGVKYGMITLLLGCVWKIAPMPDIGLPAEAVTHFIWYIGVTELVYFCTASFMKDVQQDVNAGLFSTLTGRPVGYAALRLSEWAGASVARLILLVGLGLIACIGLTDTIPLTLPTAGLVGVSILLALWINIVSHLIIGTAQVWGNYALPAYWIWSKMTMVFGGLMVPLTLYPDGFREFSRLTPFAATLFAPASFSLPVPPAALPLLAGQVVWAAILTIAAVWVVKAAIRHIGQEGD
jgi:ABC-2 type transport system permease protein